MLLLVGRTASAIAAGRASYREMRCPLLLWEGPGGVPCPGAMLLIVGRTLSAIAAGRVTHMDVGNAASPSGTGAALLQVIGGVCCSCRSGCALQLLRPLKRFRRL